MSDWITWNGGECPVAEDVLVRVKLRDGYESGSPYTAGNYNWKHPVQSRSGDTDIIAYLVWEDPFKRTSKDSCKDSMQIYCDNFLTLSKALENVGGTAKILYSQHDFLQTLARNGIEVKTIIHKEAV